MSDSRPNKRRRTTLWIAATALVATVAAVGYAYKATFARPGEEALQYVPAGAYVFGSLDLSPSLSQTMLYKRINDDIDQNGLGDKLNSIFAAALDHGPIDADLSADFKRSAAFAVFPSPGSSDQNSEDVVFIGLKDPTSAQQLLAKKAYPRFYKGMRYYLMAHGKQCMLVLGDQLALSGDSASLFACYQVSQGRGARAIDSGDYADARASLDPDCNAMLFVDAEQLAKTSGGQPGANPADGAKWAAIGLALRDQGIAISMNAAVDPQRMTTFAKLADIKPIRSDLYSVLPAGPYAVLTVSQPGEVTKFGCDTAAKQPDGQKGVQDMSDQIQKSSGIDLDSELIPAFDGDTILAAYPDPAGDKVSGIDFLAVVDDSNGADPAALVDRGRRAIEEAARNDSDHKGDLFQYDKANDEYRLTDSNQSDMQKSVRESVGDNDVDSASLTGDKGIFFAKRGKAVLVASSQKMLDRAIAAYQNNQNSMAAQAAGYPDCGKSQFLGLFSVSQIANGIENTWNTSGKDQDAGEVMNPILDLCKGLTQPLTIEERTASDSGHLGLFIPMDYEKLTALIAKELKDQDARSQSAGTHPQRTK